MKRSQLPLAGIKIVDLSIALTGPYAVALLGDQGAEVIKVERPGFGDIGRYVGVSVNGLSALAQMCNRGKRSLALDVHQPAGREILLQLVSTADVVVQNFRPGVVERLGVGLRRRARGQRTHRLRVALGLRTDGSVREARARTTR